MRKCLGRDRLDFLEIIFSWGLGICVLVSNKAGLAGLGSARGEEVQQKLGHLMGN